MDGIKPIRKTISLWAIREFPGRTGEGLIIFQ